MVLLRQLSRRDCVHGESWGYDPGGVWVDKGCRAEFAVVSGGPAAIVVECASEKGRRSECPAHTAAGVRLVEQLSAADCRHGASWGYGRGHIWVDDGCRAKFEIERTPPRRRHASTRIVTCSSEEKQRTQCPVASGGEVRFRRQLSSARCEEGHTWGVDPYAIWVDRGCRAEFEVRTSGAPRKPVGGQASGRRRRP